MKIGNKIKEKKGYYVGRQKSGKEQDMYKLLNKAFTRKQYR